MANETTSSTYSTHSLSYVLGQEALAPNLPSVIVAPHANDKDIEGQPTNVFQVAVLSDIGAASAGTEGTAITTNTALSYGSAVQGTVVEGALIRSTVTDNAVATRFPGRGGIAEFMQTASFAEKVAVLQPEVNRLAAACFEKYEDDHCNLLGTFSNTVGTSGEDLKTSDIFSAIYTYDTLEATNQDTGLFLTPNQVDEFRRDLALTGGGLGGAVWNIQADADFFNRRPDLSPNGFIGTFLGIPIYKYSHSLRTLVDSNANVAGALMALGSGDPSMPGAKVGAIMTVRKGGLKVRVDNSAPDRGVILVVSLEYVAVELKDTHGVGIHTDAP